MTWTLSEPITSIDDLKQQSGIANPHGFVYEITATKDNQTYLYIGKKTLYSKKTLPALKSGEPRLNSERIHKNVITIDGKVVVSKKDKALARKQGLKAKRTPFDVVYTESNWMSYTGSSEDLAGYTIISKRILSVAHSPISLTYLEENHLHKTDALTKPNYINQNIAGKYFANNILKGIQPWA
jgi:hypothetical protein